MLNSHDIMELGLLIRDNLSTFKTFESDQELEQRLPEFEQIDSFHRMGLPGLPKICYLMRVRSNDQDEEQIEGIDLYACKGRDIELEIDHEGWWFIRVEYKKNENMSGPGDSPYDETWEMYDPKVPQWVNQQACYIDKDMWTEYLERLNTR